MAEAKIKTAVIETLKMLVDNPKIAVVEETNPIVGLGLTSDDGLEFACVISEKLGIHIDNKVNPFVNDEGNRARTVGEIITLVGTYSKQAVGASNE